MSKTNGHENNLASLSDGQLAALESLLARTGPGTIDLDAVVAGVRSLSPEQLQAVAVKAAPLRDSNEHDRHELDGGRAYEISIERPELTSEEAAAQYESEWDEVNRLVSAGSAFDVAWETVRGEARAIIAES